MGFKPTVSLTRFEQDWAKWHRDGRKPGRFAHYCYDWDGLIIDEHDDEWASCYCGFVDKAGNKIRDKGSVFTIEIGARPGESE